MAHDDTETLGPDAEPATAPSARPAEGRDHPESGPVRGRPPGSTSGEPPGPTAGAPAARWLLRIVTAGLVLAALTLRPPITSLGALMEEVRDGLGMSGTVAGLLTSVPALCFAVFGIAAPRLARRWGPGTVVCAGLAGITLGVAARPFAGGTGGFVAASAVALAGIAVSNVLIPVVIKAWFPDRVGSMTGLYSMALALGTSLAAALTVPMTGALGGSWRVGLAGWAVPAAVAVLPWLVIARQRGAAAGPSAGAAVRTEEAPCGSRPRRPPGGSPSSSACRPPPRTSPWAGCRRSSATRGSRRAPRGCCSR